MTLGIPRRVNPSVPFVILLLAGLVPASPRPAHAANGGAAVCILPSGIRAPLIAAVEPDSGALVVFADTRNNAYGLYAQRVDRHGHPMWAAGGVLVRMVSNSTFVDGAVADGAGGCLITWNEDRGASGNDVIVQRVMPDGSLAYGASGLVACSAAGDQGESELAAGAAGFYYVVWKDARTAASGTCDLYAQRYSLAGTPSWAANGVRVNAAAYLNYGGFGNGGLPSVASDLAGGLLVGWLPDATRLPRAQRVSSAGALQWGANGVEYGVYGYYPPVVTPDGSGGAWITFMTPNASNELPTIQHVLAAGTLAFAAAGLSLNLTGVGSNPTVTPVRNASGGCMAYAYGYLNANGGAVVRQEINAAGTLLRGSGEDVSIWYVTDARIYDVGTGVVVAFRPNQDVNGRTRLVVQRFGYDGTALYPGEGVIAGRDEPMGSIYPGIASGLAGGLTVLPFADSRYSKPSQQILQVMGQAFDVTGNPLWDDAELPAVQSALDAPHDQGGAVRVDWSAGAADFPGAGTVTDYRVWRSVPGTLAQQLAKIRPVTQEGRFSLGSRMLLARANAYWEMVGEEPAAQLASYALTVPTGQDSVAGSAADESFMVEALDDSSHIWWSGSIAGHSVDNLAPPPLTSAAGYYGGGATTLYWGGSAASDLCCYDVFRGNSPGFVASDATRIGTTTNVTLTDPGAPAWYRIGARDVHGNLGGTVLVLPGGTTAVEGTVAPTAWRLRAAWHPGSSVLALALDVPGADSGTLELFDVAGRRLWGAPFHTAAASALTLTVDEGTAHVPAGVVFARASSASGRSLVTRAIVLR